MRRGPGLGLFSVGLFILAALGSRKLDALSPQPSLGLQGLRELRPLSVAASFLGQRALMGDVFWAGILQYCGDEANAPGRYPKVLGLCLEASSLAPDNALVYKFGSTFLAWYVTRPQEARILLRRGIQALRDMQDRQRLQMYLVAIEYQNTGRDRESLVFLTRLFLDGDAPPMLGPILANTFEKTGDLGSALRVWGLLIEREGSRSDLGRRAYLKYGQLRAKLKPR